MGKKVGKKVFTFIRQSGGGFEHEWSFDRTAGLCASDVRRAFGLEFRERVVDFHVTDKRPKSMTNWHFLRKTNWGSWRLTSGIVRMDLMGGASGLLDNNFPNSKTLYVCAYG